MMPSCENTAPPRLSFGEASIVARAAAWESEAGQGRSAPKAARAGADFMGGQAGGDPASVAYEAIDTAIQIAKGLGEAHARGIVHRDIKSADDHINNIIRFLIDSANI